MSVLRDLIIVLDFLSAQKTFPPQVQTAMDRLREHDKPQLTPDAQVPIREDLFSVQSASN